jgi:hypothetical protein
MNYSNSGGYRYDADRFGESLAYYSEDGMLQTILLQTVSRFGAVPITQFLEQQPIA